MHFVGVTTKLPHTIISLIMRVLVINFVLTYPTLSASQSLLWDPGIRNNCYQHFLMPGDTETNIRDNSNCSSNPERNFCANFGAIDNACPHWYALSYNWNLTDKGTQPGWDYLTQRSSDNFVLHSLANNAKDAANINRDPCDLYELAFSASWSNASFKRNSGTSPYTLGQFENVQIRFDARVEQVSGGTCKSEKRAFLHTDIVLVFPNKAARSIQIILFNPENLDLNHNTGDSILWSGDIPTGTIVALHGNRLPGSVCQGCNSYLNENWQSYSIRYKTLFEQYQTPPASYTWNDAEIQHLQLTSSNRGYDSTVQLKNLDIFTSESTEGSSTGTSDSPQNATPTSELCIDSDGDGWGWDGSNSCSVNDIPIATTAPNNTDCIDSDGDGYGWNGTSTCLAGDNQTSIEHLQTCIDNDGDGYGWNGVSTCQP